MFIYYDTKYDSKPRIFCPYTLPGKTTNENNCFIYQHGGDVDPYIAGKIRQILLKNQFYYERKHTSAYINKIWAF